MKNKKLIAFVVVLVIVSLSCNYLFPTNTNKTSNGPVVDFVTAAEPLNVTVQLDDKSTASSTITPAGGSLSLTAKNGTVFTLDVPAKALEADTLITMTVVKSITGAPLDEGALAAVQLEPSGLFFSDVVTLTIVPAQEIPIKNQIIFGYEGDGQDYHLAVVDPKSKEIKIKLMEFSGAGVGSGGDALWAANLQIQASDARTRLVQKLGEATQSSHRSQVLAGEGNEAADMIESFFEQFYDQVILKEIAAAELDCKHAQKALDDLLWLNRFQKTLVSEDLSTSNIPDFTEKALRLSEIGAKCSVGYSVSGVSNGVTYSGEICSLDKPFVLNGTFPNGSETLSFTPGNATGGTVEESGNSGECTNSGGGSYTVTLNGQGSGELQWTDTITSSCPPDSVTNTLTFKLPLNPAPDLSCP